ncbi:MAG TPA: hypothetical protein PLU22_27325, partial [Polyangiaceae bacterium]|nr:hypothetical protein [Polyangiaceae bacterium]
MATSRTDRKGGILKSHASEISALIRLVDAIVVFGTYWVTSTVYAPGSWSRQELIAALVAVVVFFLAAEMNGLYRSWRGSDLRQEGFRVVSSWAASVGALLFVAFLAKASAEYSRVATIAWTVATPVLLILLRVLLRRVLRELRARGLNTRTVAIAGSTENGERLARTIARDVTSGLKI